MLRVGVAGLGYFSRFHLDSWTGMTDVDVSGVTDPDAGRVVWAERNWSVRGCADLEGLLSRNLDILDVVAPPSAHAPVIERAVGRVGAIVCQKPFTTSISEARHLIDLAETAATALIVHENFRFQPWYRQIHSILKNGDFGTVYQARFTLRPGDGRGPHAYLDRQPAFQTMPRLLIHETAVHFLDVFRWLFGPVDGLFADLRRLNPVLCGEDAGVLILRHANGVRSVFDGNRLSDHVAGDPRLTMGEMVIEGEGGALSLDGYGRLWLRSFGAQKRRSVDIEAPVDTSTFGGGCVDALNRHVVAALTGHGTFENTARDYLEVMRLSETAYRSAASGRIEEPED
ncbi:MAG: Gfo/Idh/MocA family oxidoreductase [Pseudomonadota bacterium]